MHDSLRQDITDPATGKSRILSQPCTTCILRPGAPMHLGADRLREFLTQTRHAGTYVVCHQTLTYGDHPDVGPAICRGFADAYDTPTLRLLRRCDRLIAVDPPADTPADP
jgi:hypothetical protein